MSKRILFINKRKILYVYQIVKRMIYWILFFYNFNSYLYNIIYFFLNKDYSNFIQSINKMLFSKENNMEKSCDKNQKQKEHKILITKKK